MSVPDPVGVRGVCLGACSTAVHAQNYTVQVLSGGFFARFAESGLGGEPYCAQGGGESSFRRWRHLLGEQGPPSTREAPAQAVENTGFINAGILTCGGDSGSSGGRFNLTDGGHCTWCVADALLPKACYRSMSTAVQWTCESPSTGCVRLRATTSADSGSVCAHLPVERYKYFLKLPAAISIATPSSTALGSRISSGFTLTGSAK